MADEIKKDQNESKKDANIFEYTLKSPVTYDGKEIKVLHFDFDGITGQDCIDIEDELRSFNKFVISEAIDSNFKVRLAAKACKEKVGYDLFLLMKHADYKAVMNRVQGFLND